MYVLFNYLLTVLIWGSTWFVITFQLDAAAIEVSVALRFLIASVALFAFALVQRRRIGIALEHYPWVVMQGTVLFSINYMLVYTGTGYITSGLVAVLFVMIIPLNMIHERLLYGTRLSASLLFSALLGVVGTALVFWPEIAGTTIDTRVLTGMAFVLCAVWSASLGNMTALRNTRARLPVVAINAHGMFWGAVMSALIGLARGKSFAVDWSFDYVWSLLYLAIFGSAVAFGCYLVLIERIGSGRAAYSSVLYPVVALAVSTLFEAYEWTWFAALGIALVVAGNALVLGARTRPGVVKSSPQR